ncbi:NAD-dependent protein deacylase sirtuin-6-like [Corticium candelabrum]|uniref:NAD-dependent protein deacylase sirtuin-6-like n=1 Tax=Corticium candelabrum TaxID=121492 RepID=UPI002E26D85A|nr:NAD-dependent protein deacylase sirtuin-6-like [Corticium candelabrum]
MSVNYAASLSPYENKGKCGVPEVFDSDEELSRKMDILAEIVGNCQHLVVHTGAGVSTTAGIPDFRGPKGVWTLEKKGVAPQTDVSFSDARPTPTHMAMVALEREGILKYVVTQNIDGLHLRSGLPRNKFSELHGNVFVERCETCGREYVRKEPTPTVGLKLTGNKCEGGGRRGRCRGQLRDTVLDWEDELPQNHLKQAEYHSKQADVSLCLGTSLQMMPASGLPLQTLKKNGKLIICNLQPTKHDKKAFLCINGYVDEVMRGVMKRLCIPIPNPPTLPNSLKDDGKSQSMSGCKRPSQTDTPNSKRVAAVEVKVESTST